MSNIDVRVEHPDFADAKPSIVAARDCFLGERQVKSKGTLYLPGLSGQSSKEYQGYVMRATFYSIVGRTISALTGLAMQGEVAKAGPEEILKQMTDAPHGLQLFEISIKAISELLLQGRIGALLDAPEQARTVGIYPYVSDSIINWDVAPDGKPYYVVLHERHAIADANNRFKRRMEDRYRVLDKINGVYVQQLFDKDSKPVGSVITPSFGGRTLNHIPFYSAMPDGLRFGVCKSPMEDMVAINLSHYRTSADLEHGRHFAGLPTPVVTGADAGQKLRVGGQQAWLIPDPQAKAYYMEFKGEGLATLEKALQEKEAQLTSLSSSIISRSIRGSESPEVLRLRMSSETASLFSVVQTVQSLTERLYSEKSELEGYDGPVTLKFPTQFVSGLITADELKKYSEIYLSGGMPLDDYIAIMRRGGALSANRRDEDVKKDLEAQAEQRRKDAATAAQKMIS